MTAPPPDGSSTIVLQRLVIVLPTTGEYDSRTYRIASAAASRGHAVTVLARAAPGLPASEDHPAGYRIVRVSADPSGGIPGGSVLRPLGQRLARAVGASGPPPGAGPTGRAGGPSGPRTVRRRAIAAVRGVVRLAAIWLSIRAQTRTAREADPGADLYHGMAYMGIPVAAALGARRHAPVVYDARDIYVDAGNLARLPGPVRRVVGWAERRRARSAARIVTVNRPYAEVMAARWGVQMPLIVWNCSYRYDPPEPRDRRFHALFRLPESAFVVLYQGGLSPERGIEQLIEAIPSVPDGVLVLMGYGSLRDALERRVADGGLAGVVRFAPPVPPDGLLDWIAAADVVAMPIQASTLNHRLTTPNKLFEAMAAGVPVVASDLPGMAPIVREAGAGLLVDPADPAAIAQALNRLRSDPAERAELAANALAAAHERYHWEAQAGLLLEEYGRLTGRPW